MRLSNGVIQVHFKDKTELFYEQSTTLITYINKAGELETVLRSVALKQENTELKRRF
jgi:hypothetical protein